MARISGVSIPENKQIQISLTYVYGIGPKTSIDILSKAGVKPEARVKDLTEAELTKIREIVHRVVSNNIKRLKDIGSYRGLRHKSNLPSRGQRTRTNARTKRGKKVAVGGTQKKAASKT